MIIYSFFCTTFNLPEPSYTYSLRCAHEMQEMVTTLKKLPEVDSLFQAVLEEGPLYIKPNRHLSQKFNGYWSPSERTIYITPKSSHPQITLLFELHNAMKTTEFRKLDYQARHGQIGREEYIQSQEYLEYQNALATSALLEKGMEEGLLPPGSGWYPAESFEEHYRIQKATGHSAWIEKCYKRVKG